MKSSSFPAATEADPKAQLAPSVSIDRTAVLVTLDRTLLTVRVLQRSHDVVAERGRHAGRSADHRAESGYRSDHQQRVDSLHRIAWDFVATGPLQPAVGGGGVLRTA